MAVACVAIIGLNFLIKQTKFGLAMKACASNMRISPLMGISTDKYITMVFFLAGGLAGVGGLLLGLKYTIYPQMGNIALKAFIASVFGGLGSVPGAIVGAVFIGVMEVMVSASVSAGLRDLFTFSLLIAVLLVRPNGLFGKLVEEKA